MARYILVTTTTPTRESAEDLSKRLTESACAACVQLFGPITSTYRWKGKVETSEEWLLVIKSARSRFQRIEELIRKNHTYEVPEIIAVPISGGSRAYLAWMGEVLSE